MLHENPYEATVLGESKRTSTRLVAGLWWIVYLHPVISAALVYCGWILTTVSLGHPPGFGEHPDNDLAHRGVHVLGLPAALLFIASPVLIPIGLIWGFAQPFAGSAERSTTTKRIVCLAAYVLMLVFVASLCFWDPWAVMSWFWD